MAAGRSSARQSESERESSSSSASERRRRRKGHSIKLPASLGRSANAMKHPLVTTTTTIMTMIMARKELPTSLRIHSNGLVELYKLSELTALPAASSFIQPPAGQSL